MYEMLEAQVGHFTDSAVKRSMLFWPFEKGPVLPLMFGCLFHMFNSLIPIPHNEANPIYYSMRAFI